MKKVVLFENYPAPYRIDLYNLLAEEFDLTVCYGVQNDTTRNNKYKNEEIKFKVINLNGWRVSSSSCITFRFKKVLKQHFDCIVVGGFADPYAMLLISYLRRKKLPYILNADGGFITDKQKDVNILSYLSKDKPPYKVTADNDKTEKTSKSLINSIKRHFIKGADMYITSGSCGKEYLEYYGAERDKIRIYPFAFNFANEKVLTCQEEKQDLRKKLGIKEEKVILAVGRLIEFKRFKVMMNAYKNLDKSTGIYLVGGQPEQDYLDLQKELKLDNLHFVDFMVKDKLSDYYKMADLFVLPSDGEVWGLVVNEALYHGLPVITTTKCGSGRELVVNGYNGYLVTPNNEEELLEKTSLILDNPQLQQELAKNAFKSIADFNIENNAKTHKEIYNEFCRNFTEE